ncbi:MAG: tRNA pseudouridine(38-40) synthase TruA [Pusillimonas sp.]|nr:tRNA pseudouridine(38-40) synthase TruA [Pusillimonas sp.]
MARLALGVSYDGSPWRGWQSQPDGQTVQDHVQKAVRQFTGESGQVVCSGRTDAGVHALEQVVHLDTSVDRRLDSWTRALNSFLPPSIAVSWVKSVTDDFHARFSATARTYIYVVRNDKIRSPLVDRRVGWVFYPLNLVLMQEAGARLVGVHDFSSFRTSECQAASPVRNLQQLSIKQYGVYYVFTFKANAFLHHMVRNLMGALIYVGMQRLAPEAVTTLLNEKDRRLAPPTFAPDGLYFARVDYPASFNLPQMSAQENLRHHFGFLG